MKTIKNQFSRMKHVFVRYFVGILAISSVIETTLFGLDSQIPNLLSEYDLNRLSPNSLNRYYRNIYSQSGEDGILEEIFNRIGIERGFSIEFGGADGIWFSNTRYLWEKGWSGVMIEADQSQFDQLAKNYAGDTNMICLHHFVAWNDDDPNLATLDQIAAANFPDREIDFLSIDIDGADYLILERLKMKPKVICVEAGLHWHPLFTERVADVFAIQNADQPLAVMIQIAKNQGYLPLCLTGNLILIRSDLFHFFPEAPSDTLTLWRDGWRSSFCREWLVNYREKHPFIKQLEGMDLQLLCPITVDF